MLRDCSSAPLSLSDVTHLLCRRRDGIVHKRNEIFIDVLESVNLLVSTTGNVLRSDVTGVIKMNTRLTGMPECKFGLNDKLMLDRDGGGGGGAAAARGGSGKGECAPRVCACKRASD